ncbi:MAG: metallophosphoesterase family protein [Flavobacteriales bacterium]
MRRFVFSVVVAWLYFECGLLFAQQPQALNQKTIDTSQTDAGFSFIVSGHFHGGSNNTSGFPASTILSYIDDFNATNNRFMICLGDLFLDVRNDIPVYKRVLIDKLNKPLFNTPGNHDISGNVYQENFGKTYGSFRISQALFILLDTELDNSSIKGEQLMLLQQKLNDLSEITQVYLFSHRPVWAESLPVFEGVFPDNTKSKFGTNFNDEVYPLLKKAQNTAQVYWFSGSLGDAPASFFYHKMADEQIHFIQTAIRNLPRDAILRVNVVDAETSFSTISLTGQYLEPLQHYNLQFWQNYRKPKESFNWRLLPLYVKQMIFHRYFWYGAGFSLLLFILITFFKRKKSR